jgi:hypothetical protein
MTMMMGRIELNMAYNRFMMLIEKVTDLYAE